MLGYLLQGIFTKHLQCYLDAINDQAYAVGYSGFLGEQQSAVFHLGIAANSLMGSASYAPNAGGNVFTFETTMSGLAADVAVLRCFNSSMVPKTRQ